MTRFFDFQISTKQVIILNTEILPTYTSWTMIKGYVEINQPKTKFYHAKLNWR